MDELDRILNEEQASPPSDFAQRVMRAVMQEASTPPPIPFPWRYAFATFAAMVAVIIAGFLLSPVVPLGPLMRGSAGLPRTVAGIDPSLLAWCTSIGAALIGLLRYSVRFVTD
jgi:hypothetical protein